MLLTSSLITGLSLDTAAAARFNCIGNLFAVVGDFNVHHNILLDFFLELHILTVRKLMFPFYRGNPPPVLVGGCLIFYIAAQRGQTRYAAQLYLH